MATLLVGAHAATVLHIEAIFMFLGQTKFVLGPRWLAKNGKEKMNVIKISIYPKSTSKWFVLVVIFATICGCLTLTLSTASHFRSLNDHYTRSEHVITLLVEDIY